MFKNIEAKVIASSAGAGAGSAVGAFVLWLLGVTVWGVPNDARHAADAAAAIPEPVSGLLMFVLAIFGAYVGGYRAPHTPRPDLTPTVGDGLGAAVGDIADGVLLPPDTTPEPEPAPAEPVVDPAAGAGVDPAHPLAQP